MRRRCQRSGVRVICSCDSDAALRAGLSGIGALAAIVAYHAIVFQQWEEQRRLGRFFPMAAPSNDCYVVYFHSSVESFASFGFSHPKMRCVLKESQARWPVLLPLLAHCATNCFRQSDDTPCML